MEYNIGSKEKYFWLMVFFLGLLGLYIYFQLLIHGKINEPYGFIRLREPYVQTYLTKISDLTEQDLKNKLQQIIRNSGQTPHFGGDSRLAIDFKGNYIDTDGSVRLYQSTMTSQLNNSIHWFMPRVQ